MNQAEFRDCLSKMPTLRHARSDQPFSYDTSEVVAWVMAQPGFRRWLFERCKNTERIEYDAATGCWHGVNRGPVGRPACPETLEIG